MPLRFDSRMITYTQVRSAARSSRALPASLFERPAQTGVFQQPVKPNLFITTENQNINSDTDP
jgi:hypothetical protein